MIARAQEPVGDCQCVGCARDQDLQVVAHFRKGQIDRRDTGSEQYPVGAAIAVVDDVVPRAPPEQVGVVADAAAQRVVPGPAVERVIAGAASQRIVTDPAGQAVGSRTGIERVVAGTSVQRISEGARGKDVVTQSAVQRRRALDPRDGIVAIRPDLCNDRRQIQRGAIRELECFDPVQHIHPVLQDDLVCQLGKGRIRIGRILHANDQIVAGDLNQDIRGTDPAAERQHVGTTVVTGFGADVMRRIDPHVFVMRRVHPDGPTAIAVAHGFIMAFGYVDLGRITRRHPCRRRDAVVVIYRVCSVAAGEHIGVVATAALEQIRPGATVENVIARTSIKGVVAGEALHGIGRGSPGHGIVACGAQYRHERRHHAAVGKHERTDLIGRAEEPVGDGQRIGRAGDLDPKIVAHLREAQISRRDARLEQHPIDTAIAVVDDIVPPTQPEQISVVSSTAAQHIVAGLAIERVIADAALERVVAGPAAERIIAATAIEDVVAAIALQRVVIGRTDQVFDVGEGIALRIAAGPRRQRQADRHRRCRGRIGCGVVACAAIEGIRAAKARQDIVGAVANDDVIGRIAGAVDRRPTGQRQVLDVGRHRIADRRLNCIGAFARVLSHYIAGVVDDVGIVTKAARRRVGPRATIEHVVAGTAAQNVVSSAASDSVVQRVAVQRLSGRQPAR